MSKNEEYPQIILGTDGSYQLFIAPDVEIQFNSKESIEEYCKNKKFIILGKQVSRML